MLIKKKKKMFLRNTRNIPDENLTQNWGHEGRLPEGLSEVRQKKWERGEGAKECKKFIIA